jgi:formylglycine-generating enzyme required for sulfatase activity
MGGLVGCKDDCPSGTAVDAGTLDAGDAGPRECVIPDVSCASGEHAEYGLCILDSDEAVVTAGTFDMGAPSGSEFPEHAVTLQEFRIDVTEITNERFMACVDAGCCDPLSYDGSYTGREPYYGNLQYAQYPVIFVTWDQARQYCECLGKSLPTEAEWEYAARGSDGRLYPWGSDPPDSSLANFDMAQDGDTEAVGDYPDGASPFGVVDMAGNVWEWVADWYDVDYYLSSPSTDPPGPESGVFRVARGGSFGSGATTLYSFYRSSYLPTESFSNLGFRCAR